jgi:DNA-binding NtrC family response regulator
MLRQAVRGERDMPETQLLRVLMVDDSVDYAATLQVMLEMSGAPIEFEHRASLSEALERLKDDRLDVVLLDLNLPPESAGLDTLRAVTSAYPSMPVVVLTSMDDQDTEVQALREGAQEYLPKDKATPVAIARLLQHAADRKRAALDQGFADDIARLDRKIDKLNVIVNSLQLQGGRT